MSTRQPVTEKYPIPDDVVTLAAMRFDALVEHTGLDVRPPNEWTADETRDALGALLRSLTHHNVAGRPIHLVTVAEYLDDVKAADRKHDHYLNWWAGAQVAMDRMNGRVIDVLERLRPADPALAAELAEAAGVLLVDPSKEG